MFLTNINAQELDNYPLILVHGHGVSIGESKSFLDQYRNQGSFEQFKNFQEKLEEDSLYINKNIILPSDEFNDCNWDKRISVRTTYYVDYNGNFDDQKSISEYAERLNIVVNIVKKCTSSDKINLLGYSMGGLVVREYERIYPENANKIITIGSPNKGITGKPGPKSLCNAFRYEDDLECKEMYENSDFIERLDKHFYNNTYTISGILKNRDFFGLMCNSYGGCNDGVVCLDLSKLKYAKNYIIYSEKPSELKYLASGIHKDLIEPGTETGNKVYDTVKKILSNQEPLPNEDEFNSLCKIKKNQFDYYTKSIVNIFKEKLSFLIIKP